MDQCSHTKSNISPRGFYELTHSDLPYFFVNLLDALKLKKSITASFSRGEPLADFRLRQQVQIGLNLFSKLLVHTILVEQVAAEAGQARNQRHDCFSSGSLPAMYLSYRQSVEGTDKCFHIECQ